MLALAIALATAWPASLGLADDDEEDRRHWRKPEKTLTELVTHVHRTFEGTVLEAEGKHPKHDRGPRYKVKLLTPEGRIVKLEFDADTLELIKYEGDDHEDGWWEKVKDRADDFWDDLWK